VIDGLGIGVEVDIENQSQGDFKVNNMGFGPSVFYYIGGAMHEGEVKGKAVPFLHGSFLFSSEKTEYSSNDEVKFSGYCGHIGAGGIFMLSNSVGVFGEAYYELHSSKQKEPVETDSVDGNQLGLMIGVTGFFDLTD
jgi:hypothetical protein